MIKIILKKEVENLGKTGEVVNVSDGYARNYLFPQSIALKATDHNIKLIEEEGKRKLKKYEQEKENALELSKTISGISLTIKKRQLKKKHCLDQLPEMTLLTH